MNRRYSNNNTTATITVHGRSYYYEVDVEVSLGSPQTWDDPGDPGGLEGIIGWVAYRDDGLPPKRCFVPTAATEARLARALRSEVAERAMDACEYEQDYYCYGPEDYDG